MEKRASDKLYSCQDTFTFLSCFTGASSHPTGQNNQALLSSIYRGRDRSPQISPEATPLREGIQRCSSGPRGPDSRGLHFTPKLSASQLVKLDITALENDRPRWDASPKAPRHPSTSHPESNFTCTRSPTLCLPALPLTAWLRSRTRPQHPRQKSSRPRPTQTVRQGVICLYPRLRDNKPCRDLESPVQRGSRTWPLWSSTQSLMEIVQNADAQGPTQSTCSRRSGIGFRLCISNRYPCKSLREYSGSLFLVSDQGEGTQLV